MKTSYLNASVETLATILETTAQASLKRENFSRKESNASEKPYALQFDISGGLNGFFSVHFDQPFALALIEKLTGGMGNKEKVDDMGKSALGEIGNMIKGSLLNELGALNYDCSIESSLNEGEEIMQKTNPFTLHIDLTSDIGDLEVYIHLN